MRETDWWDAMAYRYWKDHYQRVNPLTGYPIPPGRDDVEAIARAAAKLRKAAE
jgi:hypothetical protein